MNNAEGNIFELGLPRRIANHRPLTPLDFLGWCASVFPDRVGVVYGRQALSWGEVDRRCRRLASALVGLGVGRGDTVAVMCPNTPPMLEAHYGVPMAGAVLNALNFRLDAASIAFILEHGEAKVLLTDSEWAPLIKAALAQVQRPITVIDIVDPAAPGELLGVMDYEALLERGDPAFAWEPPANEWDAISLCYTSGTTGNPKGVVYHHRGAFLNAMGNALTFGLSHRSVYLWTLPMFHCNGWTYTWAVTAVGGTHVCLRKVDPAVIFPLIADAGVTHLCGAPIVLNMLVHAPAELKRTFARTVEVATGGAAPPSAVIEAMEGMGLHVTHLYGLTECYGPATVCIEQTAWSSLPPAERAGLMARQGVRYPTLAGTMVADPTTMAPVPADATTLGEIMLRGNTVMKGYLKNPTATTEAFHGDWYHTGDLAVLHPDGYVEVKDRAKDIIISGGENISSLEVEEALYRHPAVMEAAVVAMPDPTYGERPCAFVTLRPGAAPVIHEVPRPQVPENAALIQIGACGVCGTDLHILKGHWPKPLPWPFTLGHEIGGVIVEKGRRLTEDFMGKPLEVGSRVMIPPLMPCGRCHYCVHYPESANKCLTPVYYGRYLGFDKAPHLWGGWAEHAYVDLDMLPGTKIYKLPDDMPLRLGALAEPLTSCIRAFNRATRAGGFHWGDTVVIQGSGPIGILAVAAAQEMGAGRVICVGAPEAPRLELARKFGAEATVDIEAVTTPEQRIARVREIVGGFGADLVMDCSGHPSAGPEGIEFLRDGGTYVEMGQFTDAGSIATSWHRICTKDLNVLGSWAFTGNDLPLGVDMLYRARHKYPWFDMQTLYSFDVDGISRAIADAMAMRTVKSTIVPWPELLQ